MKHINKFLMDKAFTYHIKDYDNLKREYILINTITKEIKRVPKADVEDMIKEQSRDKNKQSPQNKDQKTQNDLRDAQLHDPHHNLRQPKLHDPHHNLRQPKLHNPNEKEQ